MLVAWLSVPDCRADSLMMAVNPNVHHIYNTAECATTGFFFVVGFFVLFLNFPMFLIACNFV